MPKQLTWDDAEDIAFCCPRPIPNSTRSPSALRTCHKHVIELPDFKDDPKKSNEGKLEAIQMAWHTEFLTAPKAETAARLNSYTPNNVHGQIVFLCLVSFTS